VGFNEMATNYGVNGGRSNRNCPAKELALLLGKLFFEELGKRRLRCVLWLHRGYIQNMAIS
jgi:hypothetical protein